MSSKHSGHPGLKRKASSPTWKDVDLALDRQGKGPEDDEIETVGHDTRLQIVFGNLNFPGHYGTEEFTKDKFENLSEEFSEDRVYNEIAKSIYESVEGWQNRRVDNPDVRCYPSRSALLTYAASTSFELGRRDIPLNPEGFSERIAQNQYGTTDKVIKALSRGSGDCEAEVFGVDREDLEELIDRSYKEGQREYDKQF